MTDTNHSKETHMASSVGSINIAGSVTVTLAGNEVAMDFSVPITTSLHMAKGERDAKITVDTEEFKRRVDKLSDWLREFPLANG